MTNEEIIDLNGRAFPPLGTDDEIIGLKGRAFWEAFFARGGKGMSNDLASEVQDRALDWHQCACCALKRERRQCRSASGATYGGSYYSDTPASATLEKLGVDFALLIDALKWPEAKELYDKIQAIVDQENAL